MDLFNPPPTFEYKKMSHKLDTNTLENPYIQVVWEDYAENITQEKIKSVRHYFQKKYLSTNVNVITKTKTSEETTQKKFLCTCKNTKTPPYCDGSHNQ
jgi:hypothetical protein